MSSPSPHQSRHSDGSAPSSPGFRLTTSPGQGLKRRGRAANVYDAVAGRVTLNVALRDSEAARVRSKRRLSVTADRYSSRNPKLAPEEVLFRRKNAPVRYAEQDIYWANEDLPDGGRDHLPDESLLRAVHGYASKFYHAMARRVGPRCLVRSRIVDERSMDETALLAFGILIEEAGREALGKAGDLVFTEAAPEPRTVDKAAKVAVLSRALAEQTLPDKGLNARQDVRRAKRRRMAENEGPRNRTT